MVGVEIWFISSLETKYMVAKDVLSVRDDRKRNVLIVGEGDTLDEGMSFKIGNAGQKNEPRYQCTFVSLEIFSIIWSRSVVYTNGGVPVGFEVLFTSFAITVPFGRDATSSAVS
jgi:hypothetical protein